MLMVYNDNLFSLVPYLLSLRQKDLCRDLKFISRLRKKECCIYLPGVGLPLGTDGPPVPYPVTCCSVVLHLQNFFLGKHLAAGFVSGLGGAETGAKVTGGSVGSSVTSP